MAHIQQQEFLLSVKDAMPTRFRNCSVLDVGSMDINGNNRYLFDGGTYIGIDVALGKNVDVVSLAHRYVPGEPFDIVITTECLEHDPYWDLTLNACAAFTRSNGLFLMTCATTGREEHGTHTAHPECSPLTLEKWSEYYRNLTESDIRRVLDVDGLFRSFAFRTCFVGSQDLYFWGIKK